MGFLSGLFGKPKKSKESANDRALADISQSQFNRYQDRFAPLTGRLDDLSTQDKSATLRGRGNADVMQAMGSPRAPGSNGQLTSATRTGTRALGSSLTGGTNSANERSIRLTKGVMDAATGAGQEAIAGLGNATQLSTQESIRKMKEDVADGLLVTDFLGSAAGGAMAYGMGQPAATKPMGARASLRTLYDTGNGVRGPGGFTGVGL
jgi:hypothetical protein